jgi:hypothetical protein
VDIFGQPYLKMLRPFTSNATDAKELGRFLGKI